MSDTDGARIGGVVLSLVLIAGGIALRSTDILDLIHELCHMVMGLWCGWDCEIVGLSLTRCRGSGAVAGVLVAWAGYAGEFLIWGWWVIMMAVGTDHPRLGWFPYGIELVVAFKAPFSSDFIKAAADDIGKTGADVVRVLWVVGAVAGLYGLAYLIDRRTNVLRKAKG